MGHYDESALEDSIRVLLIENNPSVIADVQSVLSEIKECQVSLIHSHAEILSSLRESPTDLILVAHTENFVSILGKLREQDLHSYVIVMLPEVEEKLIDDYIEAGANGLVFKNHNLISDLNVAVRKALIRVVEKRSFLAKSSVSGSFFVNENNNEAVLHALKAVRPGERLLHYEIVQPLGEGGMGEVYAAKDLKLGRKVAIKLLPKRSTRDEVAQKRLIREARSASSLNHPNIITIYAVEETPEASFIVMEFIEGQSLADIAQREKLDLSKLVDIGIQTSEALAAAHAVGVIHRDVKPGNIMLTQAGHVKLLDFGLAKWMPSITGDSREGSADFNNLTEVGVPVGTASYMSPEQTRGEDLDARTDIFSLGSVLYLGATGNLPFKGGSLFATMHMIATEEVKPPSQVFPLLPPAFDEIILRCMAKERSQRYQSASEVATALRALKTSLNRDAADPVMLAALNQIAGKAHTEPPRINAQKRGTIFLVEDNEDNRDMLMRRLQRKGFQVSVAVDGEQALQKIPTEMPDLVLMDIGIPIVDGIEVTRRLKISETTRKIPIIALTAHANWEDKETALGAGCDDYDSKPVDFQRLLKKIEALLPGI